MLSEVQAQLLNTLSRELFCSSAATDCSTDLPALLLEAEQQSVLPLAFQALEETLRHALAEDEFAKYSEKYLQYMAKAIQNVYLHGEVHGLLEGNQVPYIMLKGLCSAMYYPEPMLRTMGDVDFLVSLEDRDRADKLLLSAGFQRSAHSEGHGFHWNYRRDQDTVELHWSVPGLPLRGGEKLKTLLEDAVSTGQPVRVCDVDIRSPDPLRHGLVLLLHTASHLTAGGAGLRHLCDWLVFENSFSEQGFLEIFEKPLKESGLWTFAAVLTKTGIQFFNCEDRLWCSDVEPELAEALLEDFFDGGNFGTKNNSRQGQTKIIRNNASREIDNQNILRLTLGNIDQRARHDYPLCDRHAVLRPLFWAVVSAQYLVRVKQGKRVNVFQKDVFSGAEKRLKLYKKLQLFKPEQS